MACKIQVIMLKTLKILKNPFSCGEAEGKKRYVRKTP